MIISPCISICKTDPLTGYCYGCGRSNKDKIKWKKENIKKIQKRLNGWQLKSFKESYKHKIENGISLFKKENQK